MSILKLNSLSFVQERDIDLLVVEELRATSDFAEWLVARTWGFDRFKASVGTWHSVTRGALGESDIVYVFDGPDAERYALLIENKINAITQPDQAARYRLRGDQGKAEGDWKDHRTCIIAPDRYLNSERHPGGYDYQVSYEELMAFMLCRQSRDSRYFHKAQVICEAIEQNRRGYLRQVSQDVTTYFGAYFSEAVASYPELGPRDSGERAAGNTWMYFRPIAYPPDVQLVHQTTSGNVKLFFDAQVDRIDEIKNRLSGSLTERMRLEPAGKSVSISVAVPTVQPASNDFAKDKPSILMALKSLQTLDTAYRKGFLSSDKNSTIPSQSDR